MASSLLNLLLDDQFHYSLLAVALLALIFRLTRSLLPRNRLALLEDTLENIKDMVLAAEEKGLDPKFILEVQLALQVYVASPLSVCQIFLSPLLIDSILILSKG